MAVRPPHEQALTLHQQVARHFANDESLRLMVPEQLHITLRFLGNSYRQQLDQIVTAFAVSTGHLTIFPNRRRPRVLALEIKGGQTLERLVDMCEQVAVQCGFAAETRCFRGHITLGRFRRHLSLPDSLIQLADCFFAVAQVELLESVNVHRAGSQIVEYKTLHEFNLSL